MSVVDNTTLQQFNLKVTNVMRTVTSNPEYGVSLNVLPLCELYRNLPTPDTTNFFTTKPKNQTAPEAPISSSEETPSPSPSTSPIRPTPTKKRLILLDSSDEDQASEQPPITPRNTSHTKKTKKSTT
ncbi:hypothetical protein RvY_13124 [Ramazzottius varieornatus]|uniref:Uncharacterized protein n=1 Tax=Ramazzottius varieornatus TaxID=947166 RepID=A0A1D1VLU2_RAMVA|nr:hypothetical protein RvY_13124 [Ramazzottius varieornatus]